MLSVDYHETKDSETELSNPQILIQSPTLWKYHKRAFYYLMKIIDFEIFGNLFILYMWFLFLGLFTQLSPFKCGIQ